MSAKKPRARFMCPCGKSFTLQNGDAHKRLKASTTGVLYCSRACSIKYKGSVLRKPQDVDIEEIRKQKRFNTDESRNYIGKIKSAHTPIVWEYGANSDCEYDYEDY